LSACCLASTFLIACNSSSQFDTASQKPNLTDRERDGLVGSVKAVLTDDLILGSQNGQQVETQQASSTSIYDGSGKRTTQTPYRIALASGYAITEHDPMFNAQTPGQSVETPAANLGGKWLKRYDGKGYLTEATRYDEGGKPVESLSVRYEFDDRGNWVKRAVRRGDPGSQSSNQLPSSAQQMNELSLRRIIYFDAPAAGGAEQGASLPMIASLKSPIDSNEENLARGKALFNQKCASCHGENGKAETPFAVAMPRKPSDLTGEKVRGFSEGAIYSVVSNGVGGMPAFKDRVADEALWQIALYTWQLSRKPAPSGPANAQQAAAPPSAPKPALPPPPATAQRYPFKGKVVSVDRESREVMVAHDEIKGYMGAMTMSFPLNDENALGKIKKDDQIEATLVVDAKGWRLEKVTIKP
jgi:mono/diheme cytochrome c family protein/Cu/Ag efflux protein CusF